MTDLLARLRAETAHSHRELEARLDLLSDVGEARIRTIVARFWGFHKVWEPAVEAALGSERVTEWRRLPLLETDLRALGMTDDGIAALPICDAAAFVSSPAKAWGSLYVLEGSSLGGAVIHKALETSTWLPEHGIRYFRPYGSQVAKRWRAFQMELLSLPPHLSRTEIVEAAVQTFQTLKAWLPAARQEAA